LLVTNPTEIYNTIYLTGPGINNYRSVIVPPDGRLWLPNISGLGVQILVIPS
jgi:hypothetical protein